MQYLHDVHADTAGCSQKQEAGAVNTRADVAVNIYTLRLRIQEHRADHMDAVVS